MSPTKEHTMEQVPVKVSGLTAFAKNNKQFKARNERFTISVAATNILDLIFLSDGKIETPERVSHLLSELRTLTEAINQVAEANA